MKLSKLWDSLARTKFAKIDEVFLDTFREPGNANNRLAAWDPFDSSMRYFKFLFFHQVQSKDDRFFSGYARIGNTSLGRPVTLKSPSGLDLNLDHFFSIEEYTFLSTNLDFTEIERVVEIGAGFGRTAQALIKLVGNVRQYAIIDIPEVLELSRAYLKMVLTKAEFAKLVFVNALTLNDHIHECEFRTPDLIINIDSFQEMPQETIRYYLDKLITDARFFYSKNPIGKYRPESVGLSGVNEDQLMDVFSLGLSTDVIDIFNEGELVAARLKHIQQYRPSELFDVIATEPLGIFPYYLNVLYQKALPKSG